MRNVYVRSNEKRAVKERIQEEANRTEGSYNPQVIQYIWDGLLERMLVSLREVEQGD